MRKHTFPVGYAALTSAIVMTLAGCASNQEIPELQAAQAVVAQVQSSPMRDRAATNVNDAIKALEQANKAAARGGNETEVKHLAYLATRNAEIANEKILRVQAEQAVKQGEARRQQVLAEARQQQLARARAQAQSAQAEAQQFRSAAQQAAMEREELERQLQSMKELNAKQTNRGLVLTLGDVLFDVNKATLKPGAMRTMDQLAEFLRQNDDRSVVIEGHTDSTGSDEYNMELSRRRADAVLTALAERGVQPEKIRAVGKGESTPVASNDNAAGRQENRRVEIIVPQTAAQVARESEE